MTYIYYKDAKGEWRWRLKADNGRIVADSGEGYSTEAECVLAIQRVKRSADAPLRREPPASSGSGSAPRFGGGSGPSGPGAAPMGGSHGSGGLP